MTREDYQKNIATRPIRHFNINLTNQCNLRCYYCFAEHNPRNITWDTMKATIDFAINQYLEKEQYEDTLNFTFFGGEPMLRYDDIIVPSVKYIKDIFKINTNSNGVSLYIEQLAIYNKKLMIKN